MKIDFYRMDDRLLLLSLISVVLIQNVGGGTDEPCNESVDECEPQEVQLLMTRDPKPKETSRGPSFVRRWSKKLSSSFSTSFKRQDSFVEPYVKSTVLLGTVGVEVLDGDGNFKPIRAFIDSGCGPSVINVHTFIQLRQLYKPSESRVGSNAESAQRVYGNSRLFFRPLGSSETDLEKLLTVEVAITDFFAHMPKKSAPPKFVAEYDNKMQLMADPLWHTTATVEILLGVEVFPLLFTGKVIGPKNPRDGPCFMSTVLGWVLIGRIDPEKYPEPPEEPQESGPH